MAAARLWPAQARAAAAETRADEAASRCADAEVTKELARGKDWPPCWLSWHPFLAPDLTPHPPSSLVAPRLLDAQALLREKEETVNLVLEEGQVRARGAGGGVGGSCARALITKRAKDVLFPARIHANHPPLQPFRH